MAPTSDASSLRSSERNALLQDLSADDYAALARHLDEVTARTGHVLAAARERPSHIYFPQTGIVSYVTEFADGGAVETGTVGCEGFVGIAVYLDAEFSLSRTVVQIEATLRRLPTAEFRTLVEERPAFERTLRRYAEAYLSQVAQTAACNRMHDLDQRAARWLLMTHDRVGHDTFALTHEFLAMMLGVRRAGVSEAAADMQRAGAIRYSRGRVTITDRGVLERRSCECYRVIRERFDSLLGAAAGAGAGDGARGVG